MTKHSESGEKEGIGYNRTMTKCDKIYKRFYKHCFLLKRYGNSTIFTKDIYNANNAYRTPCASFIRSY